MASPHTATAAPSTYRLFKTIKITPSGGQIAATTFKSLTALGIFADGTTHDITANVIWSSSDTKVTTVDSDGTATGNFAGTALISATMEGITASTAIKVSNASIASIAFTPASSTLAVTTSRLLRLTGTFTDGTTQLLNDEAVWSTDDPRIVDGYQTGIIRVSTLARHPQRAAGTLRRLRVHRCH